MVGGSSKLGRGGGRGGSGSGGPPRGRSSFPPPMHRNSSAVGRMSSGGIGGSSTSRHRSTTSTKAGVAAAAPRAVEESFSLVPGKTPPAFAMSIRLVPDLVEEIRRIEAQGETAKIKFDSFPNNTSGNIISVGGKEYKFSWSREFGDLCDIYEEHQGGEDGDGVMIEAGCAWRKLNVHRTLDESTTNHMKMRSVEAEQKNKSRKSIVLEPGNPTLTKKLALAEANPWRPMNKQKKEPPPKKRKIDPPPVQIGGSKPAFKPVPSITAVKGRLSASPGPSPPNQVNTSPSPYGNFAKSHMATEDILPVHAKSKENTVVRDKDPSSRETNASRDTFGNKSNDLQTLLINLLKEAPMSLKGLEKAIGDKIPNAGKKIEPILKKIANFQAPGRYFLKSGTELDSSKKHSYESGSSPEDRQLLPGAEHDHNQLPVQGTNIMENFHEPSGKDQKDGAQSSPPENIDIERHSPIIPGEEKAAENREGSSDSGSDSDSESDNSDSGSDSKSAANSDSGSSSDSEASSNSKEGSDEDVDIMSDDDRVPRDATEPAELASAFLAQIDGTKTSHDESAEKEGDGSDAVDIEGHSSDEDHGSDDVRNSHPSISPTANEEGMERIPSGSDNNVDRQNFIGSLFDETENNNNVKESFHNEQSDCSERVARGKSKRGPDLEHFNQIPERVKRLKGESLHNHSSPSKRGDEPGGASASQMLDSADRESHPHRGLNKAFVDKSNSEFQPVGSKISKTEQIKPIAGSGRPNKYTDANVRKYSEEDRNPHEIVSSRTGKVFRNNQRDDNHLRDKFPRNKKESESASRHALSSDPIGRKHGELDGNDKDSPMENHRIALPKSPAKGNGFILQKVLSDLELGELREPLGEETAAKQLERKSSFKQSDSRPSTSENRDFNTEKRKSKPAATHAGNGTKGISEPGVEDSARPHKWGLQSHVHHPSGTDNNDLGPQFAPLEETENRLRPEGSVEGYGENNKKACVVAPPQIGSKQGPATHSSKKSKRHAASAATANLANGQKNENEIPRNGVDRKKRETKSFDEEDSSYLKYEKASPELKGPISDILQYKAYMQEYQDKYGSYCSLNKILENYRNEFRKMGEELESAKGRDVERYNKSLQQLKRSYRKNGERHKRLKKIFIILHEELKLIKQRMKEYASCHGKD